MKNKTAISRWADIPISPRKWPFFYGWIIMAATTLGVISSIPGQTMGMGIFTETLVDSLNLSALDLSTAYMFGTLASSMILPGAGWLLDRIGSRIMIVFSAVGLGVSLIVLSRSPQLVTLAPTIHGSIICMSFIFLCIRFFGQGCLTMVSRVTLGKWFNYRRGLATAIAGVFITFGFNGSPAILNGLLQAYDWQSVLLILSGLIGVGMSLLGLVFYRDNPEACGLTMDGLPEVHDNPHAKNQPAVQHEYTMPEALKTLNFWAFSLGLSTVSLLVTAMTFLIAMIGEEIGLARDTSYSIFIPMGIVGIIVNFISSWLSDHIKLKWLLVSMMISQLISLWGLRYFGTPLGHWAVIIGQGGAGGMLNPLSTVIFPRYFGRLHLGKISGMQLSMMVFASAIGPFLFSKVQTLTGSYHEIIIGCMALPLTIILMGLRVKNPQKK